MYDNPILTSLITVIQELKYILCFLFQIDGLSPNCENIVLPLQRYSRFVHGVDLIMNNIGADYSYHLGANYYAETFKKSDRIHFTKYDDRWDGLSVVSLDEGISITQKQFELIVSKVCAIEAVIPELSIITPCYLAESHKNHLNALSCDECNHPYFCQKLCF